MARKKKPDLITRVVFGGAYHFVRLFFKGVYGIFLGLYMLIRAAFLGGAKKVRKEKGVELVDSTKETNFKMGKRSRVLHFLRRTSKRIPPKYDGLNVVESLKGDFQRFENKVLHSKSRIGIVIGARGSGKSAIGMRMLENIKAKTRRKVAAMGFKADDIPKWIKHIDDIKDIEQGSFVLVDEGGIHFSSRSSMTEPNKLLSELLLIARHKDLSILFITQNSSNLEINTLRQADYLVLKPSSLLQKDFERKRIKVIYDEVHGKFEELRKKGDEGLTYIYSDEFKGFVSNSLPSFWSEEISKAFRRR